MSENWRVQQVGFPLRLGDLTLASPHLTMLVDGRHFLGRTPGMPGEPTSSLPRECSGYLYRSQPVTRDPPRVSRNSRWLQYVSAVYDHRFTDLTIGYDAYMARFSGKTRSTLLRKLKKFEAEAGGPADMRVYRTPAEMDEFQPLARQVSRLTYQERLLRSGLPEDADFRDGMRDLAVAGRVFGFLLFLHGQPIAYICCPAEGDALLYAHVGFDPAFAALSPGTVLQLLALKVLFADGRFRLFDFTEGDGAHKALFATSAVRCADVYLLRPTIRNRALVGARLAVEGLAEVTGRTLDRVGLKRLVKRWLRRASGGGEEA